MRPRSPSASHPNRAGHNRLLYRLFDEVLQAHRSTIVGAVYDLGCGEMPYRDWILKQAESYVGVDWSTTPRGRQPDLVADLSQPLPIPDAVADTVLSFSVLEHVQAPEVMLGEAFRILKPGGQLLLQVPWQWWVHEAPNDYFRYSPFALRKLLAEAGFREVVVTPIGGAFSMLALKYSYVSQRSLRGPRWVRPLSKALLLPTWWLGQAVAPWLDRFDEDWTLETCGYFVTAHKR